MNVYKGRLDGFSVAASLACAVHCILLPLFVTTLPVMGMEIMENNYLECLTILLSGSIGLRAILKGYKNFHRNVFIVWAFAFGIAVMALANFLPETPEKIIKIIAIATVIAAHFFNYKLSKNGSVCCDE